MKQGCHQYFLPPFVATFSLEAAAAGNSSLHYYCTSPCCLALLCRIVLLFPPFTNIIILIIISVNIPSLIFFLLSTSSIHGFSCCQWGPIKWWGCLWWWTLKCVIWAKKQINISIHHQLLFYLPWPYILNESPLLITPGCLCVQTQILQIVIIQPAKYWYSYGIEHIPPFQQSSATFWVQYRLYSVQCTLHNYIISLYKKSIVYAKEYSSDWQLHTGCFENWTIVCLLLLCYKFLSSYC